jgi:hypothetical protein
MGERRSASARDIVDLPPGARAGNRSGRYGHLLLTVRMVRQNLCGQEPGLARRRCRAYRPRRISFEQAPSVLGGGVCQSLR